MDVLIPSDWSRGWAAQQQAAGSSAPAASAPPEDIGWPRQTQNADGTLVYYQPQVEEWKDYKELKAKTAFSLTPKGGKEELGVVDVTADTLVNKENRLVYFRNLQFPNVRFPSVDDKDEAPLKKLFLELIPRSSAPISVDRLMADLDQSKAQATPGQSSRVELAIKVLQ